MNSPQGHWFNQRVSTSTVSWHWYIAESKLWCVPSLRGSSYVTAVSQQQQFYSVAVQRCWGGKTLVWSARCDPFIWMWIERGRMKVDWIFSVQVDKDDRATVTRERVNELRRRQNAVHHHIIRQKKLVWCCYICLSLSTNCMKKTKTMRLSVLSLKGQSEQSKCGSYICFHIYLENSGALIRMKPEFGYICRTLICCTWLLQEDLNAEISQWIFFMSKCLKSMHSYTNKLNNIRMHFLVKHLTGDTHVKVIKHSVNTQKVLYPKNINPKQRG